MAALANYMPTELAVSNSCIPDYQTVIKSGKMDIISAIDFQGNATYGITGWEIYIYHFYVKATDRSIVSSLLNEAIANDLHKLSSLIKTIFGDTAVDLTYCDDEGQNILLINIHGTEDPYKDIQNLDRLNDEWYRIAADDTVRNLLLDVVD